MNKKILTFAIALLIVAVVTATAIYFLFPNEPKQTLGLLTESQARIIAEKSCIKGGKSLAVGVYDSKMKTWWFDANLNSVREGCIPACVVSEETKIAEIKWQCTDLIHAYPGPPVQINPNNPPSSGECGVANCHGLDIECGTPVQMCTEVYQLGDKCRQYAKCGKVNGKCQQIEGQQFNSCKSCVQKCEKDFPNDAEKALDCESMC
jgi:hypothetical protein